MQSSFNNFCVLRSCFPAALSGDYLSSCEVDCGSLQQYSDDDDDEYDEDDEDQNGSDKGRPRPRISCAVLDESDAKAPIMFVGMSCYANRHPRYTNERGHGNIKIIYCPSGRYASMRQQRTQFVGHRQPVHALSLIPGRALVSIDFCLHPQYIIVWNIARSKEPKDVFFYIDHHNMFQSRKINIGGGQILKRLRLNNLSYRNSIERKAADARVDYFGSKMRKLVQEHAPYHKIRSIHGISTARICTRNSWWMNDMIKQAADVLVLYCNNGRLLCYITLNLGGDTPMQILGYRKLGLSSGFDQCCAGCFRMAPLSTSVFLPSSQYANYSAAVDVLETASNLLHQSFNQTKGFKHLKELNCRLDSELQPTDEFTDMSWNTPDMPSSGEVSSSGSSDSNDDAVSLKFKMEHDISSEDDADNSFVTDQTRLFQLCFPDLEEVSPRPSGNHAANVPTYDRCSDDDETTAPRVFAFSENTGVAGYGDGSLRLQPILPNFSLKNSVLAARCSSTVFAPLLPLSHPQTHAHEQCSFPPECSSEPPELEHSYYLNDDGERFDRD
jgi:hypothetical protein